MLKQFFGASKKTERSYRGVFITMLVFGIIGLVASFVLTVEKFHLLENPDASLSCSFNLVLNCSTVMQTWQSSVFGFPNMLIGLMAYSVVITLAVLGLGGVRFPRKILIAANVCFLLGAIFAYWLFFSSLYVIQVLCPWCLIVTFSTTILLEALTHYNLRENTFNLSKAHNKRAQKFLDGGFDKLITASWLVLMVALVFVQFGASLFA